MPGLSMRLADWAAALELAEVPPEVLAETRLRILDMLGAMLAGTENVLSAKARRAAAEEGGSGATIIGFGDAATVESASLVNGILAHVLEFDDTHVEGAVHPSSPVLAAILSAAQQRRLPGDRLLLAMLVGNELCCRLSCVAPGMLHRHGFHPTGVVGAFGGTYALARLLGLPPRQMADAVGIVGSMSAALMASWEDGADTKSLHAGLAAAAANRAVALARHGIGGSGVVLEGRFGFFRSHVQDAGYALRFDAATEGLGTRWEAMNVASKVYPCGHYIQPFLDAAAVLIRDHAPDPAEIAEVHCAVADYMVPLICEPAAEKRQPASSWHARLSLQHSIAELLVNGRLDKRGYGEASLHDPRIAALRQRVTYAVDPAAADRRHWAGDVTIHLAGGRGTLHHRFPHMRGTPGNRLRPEDIVAKFQANAEGVLPPDRAARCVDLVMALEKLDDTADLVALLAG